jgi:hypothetical protein
VLVVLVVLMLVLVLVLMAEGGQQHPTGPDIGCTKSEAVQAEGWMQAEAWASPCSRLRPMPMVMVMMMSTATNRTDPAHGQTVGAPLLPCSGVVVEGGEHRPHHRW